MESMINLIAATMRLLSSCISYAGIVKQSKLDKPNRLKSSGKKKKKH